MSNRVLEATPERAIRFLRACARYVGIRRRLERRGFTQEERRRGWDLLREVVGVERPVGRLQEDEDVRAALRELNELDEDLLALADASLKHRFPDAHREILEGLAASRDEAAATLTVRVLLERIDAAEANGQSDVVTLLAARGIDRGERDRLRALVDTAQSQTDVPDGLQQEVEAERRDYDTDLRSLRAWYEEWSTVARVAIRRRDLLIRMGLARPRRRSEETEVDFIDEDDEPNGDAVTAATPEPETTTTLRPLGLDGREPESPCREARGRGFLRSADGNTR